MKIGLPTFTATRSGVAQSVSEDFCPFCCPRSCCGPHSSMIASLVSSRTTQMTNVQLWSVAGGYLVHKEPLEAVRGMSQQVIKQSATPGSHVCCLCLSTRRQEFHRQHPNCGVTLPGMVCDPTKLFELSELESPPLHPGVLYLSLLDWLGEIIRKNIFFDGALPYWKHSI